LETLPLLVYPNRAKKRFWGLPLDDNLKAKQVEARCGLQVIDWNNN